MSELSGTVTDGTTAVEGAQVMVVDTNGSSNPTDWTVVGGDTSDSNGDWSVSGLAGGNERYHAIVQYDDGSTLYNAESLPYLTIPVEVAAPTTTMTINSPVPSIETGSAIPDSAIHRWPMDEGSGSTIADAIGGSDASITGSPAWVAGTYEGDYALDWDGVDDYASATVDVSGESEWMLSTTIETSSSQRGEVHWWDEDGSFGIIGLDVNQDDGLSTWSVGNGSEIVSVTSTTTVTDGSKHRLSAGVIEGNEIFIAVDGTIEDTASFGTVGPVSSNHYFSSHRNVPRYYEGVSDHPIIYTDASQQTIDDDYAIQPWS